MNRRNFEVQEDICKKMNTVVLPLERYEELVKAEHIAELMKKIIKSKSENYDSIYSSELRIYAEVFCDIDNSTTVEVEEEPSEDNLTLGEIASRLVYEKTDDCPDIKFEEGGFKL